MVKSYRFLIAFIFFLICPLCVFSVDILKEDIIRANTDNSIKADSSVITYKILFQQQYKNRTVYYYRIYKKTNLFRLEIKEKIEDVEPVEIYIYDGSHFWKIKFGMKEKIPFDMNSYRETNFLSWISILEDSDCKIIKQTETEIFLESYLNKEIYRFVVSKENLALKEIIMLGYENNIKVVFDKYKDKTVEVFRVFKNQDLLYMSNLEDIETHKDFPDSFFDVSNIKKFDVITAIKSLF